jgi:pimeloyl-ACP methyl ester carboxylesterase
LSASSAAQSSAAGEPAACVDNTPHTEQFVTVAPDVKLEVVDWGGSGEAMVLLTGLRDNAHVYDGFAFQFTDYFHVIGITRRGYLPSNQPQSGYDLKTRVADDIAVLDALGIDKAVLVGHSLAASELSAIGEKYKNRVDKLVYLDAYDLSGRFNLPEPPGAPPPAPADAKSLWTYQAYQARINAIRELDPAVCPGVQFDADGALIGSTTPDSIPEKILADVNALPPVDWAAIKAPRFGFFALYTLEDKTPWYPYLSTTEQKVFNKNWPGIVEFVTHDVREFSTGNSYVYIHPGAPHYVYINTEWEVVREMRRFLGINPPEN